MKNSNEIKESYWNSIWSDADDKNVKHSHPLKSTLAEFVESNGLQNTRVLEIGCGIGALQDIFQNYTGTDISKNGANFIRKPHTFVNCDVQRLPFADCSFDFVFSIYCIEHVPNPELALSEIRRVLSPGGILWIKPAWFCRPWNGRNWFHKNVLDSTIAERLLKASARLRNTLIFRSIDLVAWRLFGNLVGFWRSCLGRPPRLQFRKLSPNFNMPHVIDADAESWLDPYDFVRYFNSHGDECLSHISVRARWLETKNAVIIRKRERLC